MSFKASQLLVYFSTEIAGQICIVKFCLGRSWLNGSNKFFSRFAEKDFFHCLAVIFFLSWLLGSSKNLSFFSLTFFFRSIRYRKNQKEPCFVHISTVGVLVHPRKSLFADRCVNSLQLRDLPGVTVALAVSTPVSPVTQNCSDNGEGRSFVT